MTIYAVLCSQGEMSVQELFRECRQNKFAPILVMRQDDGPTIVPCFKTQETTYKFVKRNIPKEWAVFGAVELTVQDLEWMESKGWQFSLMDFPRKLTDVVDFDVEILEYDDEPMVSATTIPR